MDMGVNHLDEFCGSKFWDWNITWNTQYPDLTYCFQKTVLVWLPCAFLWIFSPLEIYHFRKSRSRNIPPTVLSVTKMVFLTILAVLSITDIIFACLLNKERVLLVDYIVPVVKLPTFIFSALLVVYNRKYGLRSSGVLFIFWLLMVVCGTVQCRTEFRKIINWVEPDTLFPSVSYLTSYLLAILLFLLNCFADGAPRFSEFTTVQKPCPELSASFLSKCLYTWFDGMVWKGFRRPLTENDLWNIIPENSSNVIVPLFHKYWEQAQMDGTDFPGAEEFRRFSDKSSTFYGRTPRKKKSTSIVPVLFKAFGSTFLFGAFLKLIQDVLKFSGPMLLSSLILFVESDHPAWEGYFYAVLMMMAASVESLVLAQYYNKMYVVGYRIRTALISAIYRKALRLSNTSRKESTVGEIVNLMSVDAQRLMDLSVYFNLLWSAPLEIVLSVYFLWCILGPSILSGIAAMVVLLPINGFLISKLEKVENKQMKFKDERVKSMNEVLNGIKVLKLYAWELSFEEQVLKIRRKEEEVLKQRVILDSAMSFVWTFAPVLVALVTFITYLLIDKSHVLDPQKAFVSLTLFNMIRMPLAMLPTLIVDLIQAQVSVNRINKYMNMEELNPDDVSHDENTPFSLIMEEASFSWGPHEDAILKCINLKFEEGALVAVVGSVGSGKSSLLSAFLGEMNKLDGLVNSKGSIAYVPQQAWIQNATLRDNILFEKSLNYSYYMQVIEACALKPDLEMLPAGDSTEIGEKGINLSGGQKQRVSLARAVYNDADIYLLDDPLSAVDSHVGKHIFENVIGNDGILKNKTRVLVTHSMTYLPEVDLIVVLREGEVTEMGTYKELLQKKAAFSEFLMQHCQDKMSQDMNVPRPGSTSPTLDVHTTIPDRPSIPENHSELISHSETEFLIPRSISLQHSVDISSELSVGSYQQFRNENSPDVSTSAGERLIEMEKLELGSVKWHVYLHYIKSVGWIMTSGAIAVSVMYELFSVASNVWLSKWSNEHGNSSHYEATKFMYLGVYTSLGLGSAISSFFCCVIPQLGCWLAARSMHLLLLRRILRAPLSFFDTTPSGRIIGRFSKDLDVLDSSLPGEVDSLIYTFSEVVALVVVISCTTPIFISVVLPIGILYICLEKLYVSTSRQLYRLESISRSPIYSHFGETIAGATIIRAYKLEHQFILNSDNKVDENQMCCYPGMISNRWLGVRIEIIGNFIIFFASLFAVMARDTMSASLMGLSVSYSLQITQTLSWLITLLSEMETHIVAVERVKEYGDTIQEAPWDLPQRVDLCDWPSEGKVEFRDYEVRYREGLDLTLKKVSFKIRGGEKVGIVGRTGAGKSSLTLALFRIIEAAGGSIFIDDLDISKLGLHDLRSKLTIIPQDPILFSGTVRFNLDPFGAHSEEEIWQALEHAHLKNFVCGLQAGLSHEVTEGGENLSVGQRQLICLARALLRKTQILVLDEATAAVDLETDDLIQRTIQAEFRDCTILTIAHRLNTIMDSDRVIVLDNGHVCEFDSPAALLLDKKSAFYSMARDSGLV